MAQPAADGDDADGDGRLLKPNKTRPVQPPGYIKTNTQFVVVLVSVLLLTHLASKTVEWLGWEFPEEPFEQL